MNLGSDGRIDCTINASLRQLINEGIVIELEKTYLIKELPDLTGLACKEMRDIYHPKVSIHPTIRLRKNGEKYMLMKKEPVNEGDSSHMLEQTIKLTEKEFEYFSRIEGLEVKKLRYSYTWNGFEAEIDVFKDRLEGLVLVDFEFSSVEEKDKFEMPDFCLADVTQEEFIAGGMLAGKGFEDIEEQLKKYNFKKIK